MVNKGKALLAAAALAVTAAGTVQAQIPANAGCSNAKMKCAINYTKGILGVQAKAAKGGVAEDPLGIQKITNKYSGLATSCIEKADAKFLGACPFAGDGGLKVEMDALMGGLKTQLYVNPTPTGANACFAAQTKCVANAIKGLVGADSKALKGGLFTDAAALDKVVCKYDDSASNAVSSPTKCLGLGKGCMQKLEAPGKACTLTGLAGQSASVLDQTTGFINRSTCEQSPTAAQYAVTTVAGFGSCGTTNGATNPTLNCGDLYIGGGLGTTPNGATPAGTTTNFNLAGGKDRVCPRTAAQTGSNLNCSDIGCFFGSPLPIVNGPLSTCVDNTFLAKGYGALVPSTGEFKGDILLGSTVAVTANAAEPCPKCVAGACDSAAANSGAACTPGATTGESHDCLPAGPSLPTFAVSLTGTTTGTSSLSNGSGLFCPLQANAGAFGDPSVTNITETGTTGGNLTTGPAVPATLASVFCIPATGNVLIDGAADLPGPGATSLVVNADVL
ncbi:MAG TPA: hypothetical protein VMS22_16890 [Candidatus Eisenbacteria bacterium]|nr:hypothetical protein [Candidatus Eisenbacteria bacterium]